MHFIFEIKIIERRNCIDLKQNIFFHLSNALVNIIAENYMANSTEYFHKSADLEILLNSLLQNALLKQNIGSYMHKYI